ncbi:hypothetical protein TPHA_0H00890 [Tetrapisispora phaffii CBS 4417]|uniref:Serine/threonine-protein phosphatase 4 regulatory subunit 3 n=1 Tax=Tetrapisispora phaffii (strain ATCC 24235 / CBS 4417 / NBRC 1672 / NRRL Y-8282 / UCD 70-5) TaxID=1071381 RepID=G8BWZ3_TETPH|nr:hypothetical protein TPHA_0H00890 [Tetrapisispora phaffii CBS 4417]CCE64297.1 hypothetical protein TPHA_0H00890 [Tetrapisispora phaffii CBS 4417]
MTVTASTVSFDSDIVVMKDDVDVNGSNNNSNQNVSPSTIKNTEPKRVKVYILENSEWKDTGTGFCMGTLTVEMKNVNNNETKSENRIVSKGDNDEEKSMVKSAYLVVNNEEIPDSLLLKSKLEGTIEYQRQEETLIVWKDVSGKDIALSFEESIGCDALCEFIVQVQRNVEPKISLVAVKTNLDGMGSVHEMIAGPVPLPSNEQQQNESTLLESLKILNENTSFDFLKNQTVEFILQNNYISTLINIFDNAEKEKLTFDILIVSNIIKTLILYNQRDIIEQLVGDDHIMGVVGILEYDTEFSTLKANHRGYLKENGPTFKEVIAFENEELKSIIKKCFRLQFLKDVVLVRFLDGHHLDLILDIIMDLEICIIEFLQADVFLDELVGLYSEESIRTHNSEEDKIRRKDGIKLLHQCVQMTVNLEKISKYAFYKALVEKGLFKVMNYAFNNETDDNIRIISTDMIITIIEHDILLIHYVQNKQNQCSTGDNKLNDSDAPESDITLLLILSKILLNDKSPGLKEQVMQALYTLLHPEEYMGDNRDLMDEGYNNDDGDDDHNMMNKLNYNVETSALGSDDKYEELHEKNALTETTTFQIKEYFKHFYQQVAPALFKPLLDPTHVLKINDFQSELLLIHLIKLLCFLCTEHDRGISRQFVLENGILNNISKLMDGNYSIQLKLAVLRCFKNIIYLDDAFYHRYMITNSLYDPVIRLLMNTLDEDNIINSSLRDFFKIIYTSCKTAEPLNSLNDDDTTLDCDTKFKKTNFILLNNHLFQKYPEELTEAKESIQLIKKLELIREAYVTNEVEEPTTELDTSDNDITSYEDKYK